MATRRDSPCEECRCMKCKHENETIDGIDCCLAKKHMKALCPPDLHECPDFEPLEAAEPNLEED